MTIYSPGYHHSLVKDIVMGGALIALVVGAGTFAVKQMHAYTASEIRRTDGCLANTAPPELLAIISDHTDPLVGQQRQVWLAGVTDVIAAAPPGTKIIGANIEPVTPVEPLLQSLPCVPQPGDSGRAKTLQAQVQGMEQKLEQAKTTKYSSIAESIVAVARHPDIRKAQTKMFVAFTDLLQNTPQLSVLRQRHWSLPNPLGHPFEGARVRFVVMRNPRYQDRQNAALIEAWVAWAKAGGAAEVEVDAAWAGFQLPKQEGDKN